MGRIRRRSGVLVIVQNLPVPLDRRVWLECLALRDAGFVVSVICPKGPGDPSSSVIEDVLVLKYPPAPPTAGALSFAFEFVYCWLWTAALSLQVARRRGFGVVQACNPPDTYWALARVWRLAGKRFVYDQHDLNPELFRSRFGEPTSQLARLQYRFLLWLEASTYRTADHVISTNDSYRRIALERGRVSPERVTVVRSCPDTRRMRPLADGPDRRRGRRHLLVYLGIMGPQDGVENVLHVMDVLVNRWGRDDVGASLLGFGDAEPALRGLSHRLGLEDHVHFTGRADRRMIAEHLSCASVGLGPDPRTPLNDLSTMNKTMEYMSYAVPVVSFDLTETRVSAGGAGVLAEPGDIEGFAAAVAALLDDPSRRRILSVAARRRVVEVLDWQRQSRAYVGVFSQLLGRPATPVGTGSDGDPEGEAAGWGYRLVDAEDESALQAFLDTRDAGAVGRAVV